MKNKEVLVLEDLKKKMVRYCLYQERSHKEVSHKLSEYNLIPEAYEMIFVFLLDHNYLNEERFSHSYTRGKFYQKQWGKRKIIQGLKWHDIPAKMIEKSLAEINQNDYIETMKHLISKKKAVLGGTGYTEKNKIYSYLLQKGYDYVDFEEFL